MSTRKLPIPELLLDTHVWIWVMEGAHREIGRRAREAVEAASASGRLLVSAISVWEVAMLGAKGRIQFSLELGEWIRKGLTAPGVHLVPISPPIAIDSARLPPEAHGDPTDRILMATARRSGATLVTRDHRILHCARHGLLSVLDAAA